MTAISELENPVSTELPKTLAEFLEWEPEDGFKYEWNDGEIIKFNSHFSSLSLYPLRLFLLFNN